MEQNRYILAIYVGSEERMYDTKEEYTELLNKIIKHNSKKANKIICGNVYCKYDKNINKFRVIFNKYEKLSEKMPLKDIDKITSNCDSEEDLKKKFEINYRGFKKNLVRVAYFQNKNQKDKSEDDPDIMIRFLDVLYIDGIAYINADYIKEFIDYCIKSNIRSFFNDLTKKYESNSQLKNITDGMKECNNNNNVNLRNSRMPGLINDLLGHILYKKDENNSILLDENGKKIYNYRNIRDLALLVKSYYEELENMSKNSTKEPIDNEKKKIDSDSIKYIEERSEREEDSILEEQELDRWDGIGSFSHALKR